MYLSSPLQGGETPLPHHPLSLSLSACYAGAAQSLLLPSHPGMGPYLVFIAVYPIALINNNQIYMFALMTTKESLINNIDLSILLPLNE